MTPGLHLDVATPERVGLKLPIAGIGYRSLAWLIDAAIIAAFWLLLYFLYALTGPDLVKLFGSLSTVVKVVGVVGFFVTQWVYWTASEVFWRGQTPGKRLMKIRVVRSDGSPVGLFESAVRNLLRFVDFLPLLYGVGIVVMLFDRQHRRLGDLAAGTLTLREVKVDLSKYDAPRATAPLATGRALTSDEHELLRSLADRFDNLEPAARTRLVKQLAERLGDDPSLLETDTAAKAWLEARGAA